MTRGNPDEKRAKAYRVRIHAATRASLRDLPLARMDIGCTGGIRERPEGGVTLDAYVAETVLEEIRKTRCTVEILGDAAEELKRAQAQVGKGNRFKGAQWIPRGLGKKIREREAK